MEKRGKGKPRAFKTEQEFYNKALEYINYCEEKERFANVAGFCIYSDITRETFYKQQEYYSDIYKKVQDLLENACINNKNTTMAIFYMKNKFGYKDRQEIDTNINKVVSKYFKEDEEE